MSKKLVLAEKPSVGKELARVLKCSKQGNGFIEGNDYIVTWSLGHLVTLADPELYDERYKVWSMDYLPMLPDKMKLVVIPETAKQFKVVSELMKRSDISELIVATDSGREGELVARWIMIKAGFRKPAKRLWISSQTDKAILDGFRALKPISAYDNLFKSAAARSEADWIVGLNASRALTCKFGASLSAGRVQTPTLALIVRREEEIRRFVSVPYYTVSLKTNAFCATWKDSKLQSRIFDKARADALAAKLEGKSGKIVTLKKEYKQKAPPAAYDLTELQRDANKKYAYTAKETLQTMQSLYETHKVLTYPRTDSRYITDDVAATIPDRLKAVAFGKYGEFVKTLLKNKIQTRYIVNAAKVTDHHAIIPTEQRADLMRMTGQERNIYDLVVKRFIAVLMPPFEYEETSVVFNVGGENFYASGKTVKNEGWQAVNGSITDDETDDDAGDDERGQTLPVLRQGDSLNVISLRINENKTKPPARYTEATLLSAMENPASTISDKSLGKILTETSGLGTPATRADIIEKLFSAFYVERCGKEIHPTSKGNQLIRIVPDELCSAEMTARWEQQLALIGTGKARDTDFTSEMRKYSTRLVSTIKTSEAVYVHDNMTKEKCPDCGAFLLDVAGKKGRMLVCSKRECGYRRLVCTQTNARCPVCHKKLELRFSGDTKIFACACGFREKEEAFEKRRAPDGAAKSEVAKFMKSQSNQDKGFNSLGDMLKKAMNENKDNN